MNSIEYIRREIMKEMEELQTDIDNLNDHDSKNKNEQRLLSECLLNYKILNNLLVCLKMFTDFSKIKYIKIQSI